MSINRQLLSLAVILLLTAGAASGQSGGVPADSVHVVFVTGDDEYRSEESMPMLARILKRNYGFRVTVLYALNE